jgi:hypothetical protein
VAIRATPPPRNLRFSDAGSTVGSRVGCSVALLLGISRERLVLGDGWGCWTSLLTPSMQYFQPGPSSFTTRDIVYYVALNALDKILFHNKICRFITIVLVAITSFTIH